MGLYKIIVVIRNIFNRFCAISTRRVRCRRTRKTINGLIKDGRTIYLELGAGDRKGDRGWLTLDITKQCDIYWDLREGIPFPNGSVQKIYSSHLLEHLSYAECQHLLDECTRVLSAGGIFSVCVPNAKLYVEAYVNSDPLFHEKCIGFKTAYNNTTCIDYLNYIAYMDGHHKYMFDEENLLHILTSKGFKNVRLREFDPDLDLEKRDFESIYAEAEK